MSKQPPSGTPGKKPPAPSASGEPAGPTLCASSHGALNPPTSADRIGPRTEPEIKWQTAGPFTKRGLNAALEEMAAEERAIAVLWNKPADVAVGAAAHAAAALLLRYTNLKPPEGVYIYAVKDKDEELIANAIRRYPGACLEETRRVIDMLSDLRPDAAWHVADRVFRQIEGQQLCVHAGCYRGRLAPRRRC
jgi:hypothetical protein